MPDFVQDSLQQRIRPPHLPLKSNAVGLHDTERIHCCVVAKPMRDKNEGNRKEISEPCWQERWVVF